MRIFFTPENGGLKLFCGQKGAGGETVFISNASFEEIMGGLRASNNFGSFLMESRGLFEYYLAMNYFNLSVQYAKCRSN